MLLQTAAAGDFFIQLELDSDDDRGFVLFDRSPNTLVLMNAGEARDDLDIVAEGRFIASGDAVLTGYVDWYENDTSGRQFDFTEEIRLRYDPDARCWLDLDLGGGCVDEPDGEIAAGTLMVTQPPTIGFDGCIASLEWSLRVEQVAP